MGGEADAAMEQWFGVDHLDVERLLSEWRWLCPSQMRLIARNGFGELFLQDETGAVFRLGTSIGKLTRVASSDSEFRELAARTEEKEEWFAESQLRACADRGLCPTNTQCIGFSIPLVFAESGSSDAYIADLYEYVSFLGDLNRQISTLPDGAKVRLRVQPPPTPK
jgi:hypothetical protein